MLSLTAMRQDGKLIADAMSNIGTFPVGITKIQKDMKKVQDYWKDFKEKVPWSYCICKGLSVAKHLFNLVLTLKVECHNMKYTQQLAISLRDWMITTGFDGWLHGDFVSDISLGFNLH